MIPHGVQNRIQWFKNYANRILENPGAKSSDIKRIASSLLAQVSNQLEAADLNPEDWKALSNEFRPYTELDLRVEEENRDIITIVTSFVSSFFAKKGLTVNDLKEFSDRQYQNALDRIAEEKKVVIEE